MQLSLAHLNLWQFEPDQTSDRPIPANTDMLQHAVPASRSALKTATTGAIDQLGTRLASFRLELALPFDSILDRQSPVVDDLLYRAIEALLGYRPGRDFRSRSD